MITLLSLLALVVVVAGVSHFLHRFDIKTLQGRVDALEAANRWE